MRQREYRSPTDAAIRVWHQDQCQRATALNISSGGACLGGMAPLPVNAWVTVQYLHLNIRAHVAWSEPEVVGVNFQTRLTDDQVKALQSALVHVPDGQDGAVLD